MHELATMTVSRASDRQRLVAALELLEASCRRYFRSQQLMALFIVLLGVTGFIFFLQWVSGGTALWILSLLVAATGVYAYLGVTRLATREHPEVMDLLLHCSDTVVWLYKAELQLMPFGVDLFHRGRMDIACIDGNKYVVRASHATIDVFIIAYAQCCPHVTTGYSTDRQQLFDVSPDLLKKDHA